MNSSSFVSGGGHIIVFLSGTPNVGPGSISSRYTPRGGNETSRQKGDRAGLGDQGDFEAQREEAVGYYRQVAGAANDRQVMIDIFAIGNNHFTATVLRQVTRSTGGSFILVRQPQAMMTPLLGSAIGRCSGRDASFSIATTSCYGITHVIGPTAVHLSHSRQENKQQRLQQKKSSMSSSPSAMMDQFSTGAHHTVIAPAADGIPFIVQQTPSDDADDFDDEDDEDEVFYDAIDDGGVTKLVVSMGAAVATHTFAVILQQQTDLLASDFVYVQVCSEWMNANNQRVLRVMTQRVHVVQSRQEYLQSVDGNVMAVLLAKQVVLAACGEENGVVTKGEDLLALRFVDDIVSELCTNGYLDIKQKGKPGRGKPGVELPRNLVSLPQRLFHLRRGPLLGPVLQTTDDSEYVRGLFLSADYPSSLKMIQPRLFVALPQQTQTRASVDPTASTAVVSSAGQIHNGEPSNPDIIALEEVPCEDVAMLSDWVLLLDGYTDLFIWSGRRTAAKGNEIGEKQREKCRAMVNEIITKQERFPHPFVLEVKEGSSLARWFTCKLSPLHKDPVSFQEQCFPLLKTLPEQLRKDHLGKFIHTDDMSYTEYITFCLSKM